MKKWGAKFQNNLEIFYGNHKGLQHFQLRCLEHFDKLNSAQASEGGT